MRYKLVIFDLDGTLLDTLDDLSAAVNYAMGQRGFSLHTRDEYRKMIGHGARNLIAKALPEDHRNEEALVTEVLEDFRLYYNTHIDVHTRPFPGIQQLLEKLHQEGVLLAVASNKFQEGTEHLIREFFSEIPFVDILGNRPDYPLKPDPEVVVGVLRKSGLSKEEAVMVGDSPTDMLTAENGGIDGIAVSWGYRPMKDIPGLIVVDSTDELFKIL